MIMKIAALSAALLLGTMSQAALAQTAPAAPAGTAAPAVKAPVTVPPKPAAQAKTIVGAKAAPPVNACKGLSEADCGTKADDCSFVKAYKTKAGKTVAGYCKAKPKAKAKPAAKAAAPKAVSAPAAAVKPSAPPAAKPATAAPKN